LIILIANIHQDFYNYCYFSYIFSTRLYINCIAKKYEIIYSRVASL